MSWFRKLFILLGFAASASPASEEPQIVADAKSAAELIAQALSSSGYKADFSLNSLKEVDRFFEEQAPNGKPRADGLLSQDMGARLFALGGYTGEVVLRATGGHWEGSDSDPGAEINIAIVLKDGTKAWPVQRVMKRFRNGAENGLYPYGVALTKPE